MEISNDSKDLVNQFGVRYLNLISKKKVIDCDIKALKQDFDEQGIPTKLVIKAINNIKREKKASQSERFEIEKFEDWLRENQEIDTTLTELLAS